MRYGSLFLLATLIPTAIAVGQDPTKASTPAPTIRLVLQAQPKTGMIYLEQPVIRMVPVAYTEMVNVNGMVQAVTRVRYQSVTEIRTIAINLKELEIQTVKGDKLSPEEIERRLLAGTAVLFPPEGGKIDPSHLKVFKPDTLIFLPRPPAKK